MHSHWERGNMTHGLLPKSIAGVLTGGGGHLAGTQTHT